MKHLLEIKSYLKLVMHGPFDVSTEQGRADERLRRIAWTALTALIAQLVAVLTPLITIRITIPFLGEEIYGLWITVVSFFAMITYADLGLGSGLQTELCRASAFDDNMRCKKMISSTLIVLSIISIVLIVIFALVYPYVNWPSLFNAKTPEAIELVGPLVIVILLPKLLNIPLAIVQRTQSAMQEAYHTNLWQIAANLISLAIILMISLLNGGKLLMIFSSSGVVVVVALLNMIYYFRFQRPQLSPSYRYFDSEIAKSILKTGILFCVLSIFTTVSLSIDNWIVAKTAELSDVTSYSIMLRLANLINVVSLMVSAPLWAANGEALARGEKRWVKINTDRMAALSVGLAVVMSIVLIAFAKPVLLFLSDGIVSINYIMLAGMCVLNILISFTNPYFMVLNGAKVVVYQIVIYLIMSLISIPLKFIAGEYWGIEFIPWVASLLYLIVLTVPTYRKSNKIFL